MAIGAGDREEIMSDQKKKRGSSRGTVTWKRDSLCSPPTRRSERNSASLNKSTDSPVPAPVMKLSITAKKIMPRKTLAALAFAESQPKTSSPAQKPATAVATPWATPKAAPMSAQSQPKASSTAQKPATAVVTPRFTPKVSSVTPTLRRSSRVSPNSEKENAVLDKSQGMHNGAKDQPVSKIDILSPIPLNVPQSPSYDDRAKVMSQKVRRSYSRLEMSLNGGSFLYSPTRNIDSDTSTPNPAPQAGRRSLFGFDKLGSESPEEEAEKNLGEENKQINNKSASGTSMGLAAEEPDTNIPGVALAKQKRRKRKVPQIGVYELDEWAATMNAQFEEAEKFDLVVE